MENDSKHYYRTPLQSETGRRLALLFARATAAVNAASRLAEELRADYFEPSTGCVAGGINCFYFHKRPRARRWEVIGRQADKTYAAIPNAHTPSGRAVMERLLGLPIVKNSELGEVFGVASGVTPLCFPVDNQYAYICAGHELDVADLDRISEEEWQMARQYYEDGL